MRSQVVSTEAFVCLYLNEIQWAIRDLSLTFTCYITNTTHFFSPFSVFIKYMMLLSLGA